MTQLQAALRRSPDNLTSLDALGLAYQQRARETGDPVYYTKSQEVLDRRTGARAARSRRNERARLARALAPPVRRGARARPASASDLADDRPQLRRHRRRTRRARPLPGGVRRLRPHGHDAARASPRTRASRTRASCSATPQARSTRDGARRRGRASARARRRRGRTCSSASSTGRSAGSSRTRRRGPRRASRVPGLRLRARRARAGRRRRTATSRARDRDRDGAPSTGSRCRSTSSALGDLYRGDRAPRRRRGSSTRSSA